MREYRTDQGNHTMQESIKNGGYIKRRGNIRNHGNIRNQGNMGNQGSATIEVTLLIPVILLGTCLMITLLLSVLHQAECHSEMVVHSMEEQLKIGEGQDIGYHVYKDGDTLIYSVTSDVQLVRGYGIQENTEQKVRVVDEVERIRRWQMLGGVLSE